MKGLIGLLSISTALLLAGCEQSPGKAADAGKSPPAAGADKHDHKPGDGHDHADEKKPGGHGGEVVELGTAKIGDLTVRASRDKGEINPGGEAPIDVWLIGPDGKPATGRVVRFWIGVADGKGSVKAKAEIEDPKDPSHYHTHAEIPNPIPADGKLWVEIEDEKGARNTGSFSLKQ